MLGLGETWDEVIEVMHDIREHDVDILTIGQYLRPSFQHLPIQRYIPLEEFAALKDEGKRWVSATSSPAPSCAVRIMPTSRRMERWVINHENTRQQHVPGI